MSALFRLTCDHVSAGYGGVSVVAGVSIAVSAGECVAILGRNGVGKSTMGKMIAGLLGPPLMGSIAYDGKDISGWSIVARARAGITFAPDDRGVFGELTVEENLTLAGRRAPTALAAEATEEMIGMLAGRRRHLAAQLSGGEQRILAIACALSASPRLLVIDELSEGLSARAISIVEVSLSRWIAAGMSVVLIEQRVDLALRLATRCYVMDFVDGRGRVVLESGTPALREDGGLVAKLLAL